MKNGSASLLVCFAGLLLAEGISLADVPFQNVGVGNDFDRYSIDSVGNIIYNISTQGSGIGTHCPNNATCEVLEASGTGILQQKITYDGGGVFFQTIIVDDGLVSINDPTNNPAVTFRLESYVESGTAGPNTNLAILSIVKGGTADFDAFEVQFEGQQGTLTGTDPTSPIGTRTGATIYQYNEHNLETDVITGPPVIRNTEFYFEDSGNAGKRMALNMTNGDNQGQFTLRRATGYFVDANGTIALDNSDEINYLAGANLQTVYITQAIPPITALGSGSLLDRIMGISIVQELDDNEGINGVLLDIRQSNQGPFGTFPVTAVPPPGTQLVGSDPFLNPWPTSLFGAEPLTYNSAPPGLGGLSAVTPSGGFFPAPPPWNVIVP